MPTTINIAASFDGYVKYAPIDCGEDPGPPAYVDFPTNPWLWSSISPDGNGRRSYMQGDFSVVPSGKVITKIEAILFNDPSLTNSSRDTSLRKMTTKYEDFADAEALSTAIIAGAVYTAGTYLLDPEVDGPNEIDLGSGACTDAMSHPTWFAIGITIDESAVSTEEDKVFYSLNSNIEEHNYRGYFRVTYDDVAPAATGNFFLVL